MLELGPEKVNFKISTTDLAVSYSERAEAKIVVDVLTQENYLDRQVYLPVSIIFSTVAELICTSLNFHEYKYGQYHIIKPEESENEFEFWQRHNYHPNSGFYRYYDSTKLEELQPAYDPRNRLNLKHYLVIGNDSYLEVVASSYGISGI